MFAGFKFSGMVRGTIEAQHEGLKSEIEAVQCNNSSQQRLSVSGVNIVHRRIHRPFSHYKSIKSQHQPLGHCRLAAYPPASELLTVSLNCGNT